MTDLDPLVLAKHQLDLDRARTRRMPDLLSRKVARMTASPLGYLRGAAPLYYDVLRARPDLARGPDGEGWIVGDAHLENFGAYRPEPMTYEGHAEHGVAFDLNDFDDAVPGPWRFDTLRLATSLVLGVRGAGADAVRAVELAWRLVDAYVVAAFGGAHRPPVPRPVRELVERVERRSRKQLLDARTAVKSGKRRFVRGERYRELSPATKKQVPKAIARYAARLPERERPDPEQLELIDAAQRIAGTGSLGCLRVAALVRGKGGVDGGWILDIKEEGEPSAAILMQLPLMVPATRVVNAMNACIAHPPKLVGTTEIGGESMLVHRLAPQEDKVSLASVAAEDLGPLADYFGALLGAAHARGANRRPRKVWTEQDRERLVERALYLAGVHEAAHLALAKLVR